MRYFYKIEHRWIVLKFGLIYFWNGRQVVTHDMPILLPTHYQVDDPIRGHSKGCLRLARLRKFELVWLWWELSNTLLCLHYLIFIPVSVTLILKVQTMRLVSCRHLDLCLLYPWRSIAILLNHGVVLWLWSRHSRFQTTRERRDVGVANQ